MLAFSLVASCAVAPVALADESTRAAAVESADSAAFDRADWFDFETERIALGIDAAPEGDTWPAWTQNGSAPSGEALVSGGVPGNAFVLSDTRISGLSDEFKYFTKYESGQNYDQGLSDGDGRHALGYYQMDNRSMLQPFLDYCYAYDSTMLGMFAPYVSSAGLSLADNDTWVEVRDKVEAAWHEAYRVSPQTFSALQDTYMYENTYLPVEAYMAEIGVPISGRADCIKGLCWGMANLFGLTGWHRFVGGWVLASSGWVYYDGCGLDADMSDAEFAIALAGSVVDNVAAYYPNSDIYHQGWINRYRNEIAEIISYLPDEVPGSWYEPYLSYVKTTGIMTGYTAGWQAGRFGPEDRMTRAQAATILFRLANPDSGQTTDPNQFVTSTTFTDIPAVPTYYGAAVEWCFANGIVTGDTDGSGNLTGTFRPDDIVTREQFATMIYRFAAFSGCDMSQGSREEFDTRPDRADVSDYAVEALVWCGNRGIMQGVEEPDGQRWLRPDNASRRAHVAKMVTVLLTDVLP